MTHVTAFRSVPTPIIGMVSVINDRQFNVLEDSLDWLETTGALVERFDPAVAPGEAVRRQVKQILAKGEASLPLILVDDVVILQGEYPSRARLARVVGSARHHGRRTDRPAA